MSSTTSRVPVDPESPSLMALLEDLAFDALRQLSVIEFAVEGLAHRAQHFEIEPHQLEAIRDSVELVRQTLANTLEQAVEMAAAQTRAKHTAALDAADV